MTVPSSASPASAGTNMAPSSTAWSAVLASSSVIPSRFGGTGTSVGPSETVSFRVLPSFSLSPASGSDARTWPGWVPSWRTRSASTSQLKSSTALTASSNWAPTSVAGTVCDGTWACMYTAAPTTPNAMAAATTRAPSIRRRTLRSPAVSPWRGSRLPVSHGRGPAGGPGGGPGGGGAVGGPAMTLVASDPANSVGTRGRSATAVPPGGEAAAAPATAAPATTVVAAPGSTGGGVRRAEGPSSVVSRSSSSAGSGTSV